MTAERSQKRSRRKTGCFTCRSRHVRCDEKTPTCRRCRKAGLRCEQPSMIIYQPARIKAEIIETPPPESIDEDMVMNHRAQVDSSAFQASPIEFFEDRVLDEAAIIETDVNQAAPIEPVNELPYLLNYYQGTIAQWMDLFDHKHSFQQLMMYRAVSSPLLQSSICALAAQTLQLKHRTSFWKEVADRRYGEGLKLLQQALADDEPIEHTLPATNLLMSFELMAGAGTDYTRHFKGAKALVETHIDTIRETDDELLLASYWNFFRQDVDIALAAGRPVSLSKSCFLDTANSNDDLPGNRMLVLAARASELAFTDDLDRASQRILDAVEADVDRWGKDAQAVIPSIRVEDHRDEMWFPTPAAASAMQTYHVVKAMIYSQKKTNPACIPATHAIRISQQNVADSVQVHAARQLVRAALYTWPGTRRDVMKILEATQRRTGFNTLKDRQALLATISAEHQEYLDKSRSSDGKRAVASLATD